MFSHVLPILRAQSFVLFLELLPLVVQQLDGGRHERDLG